MNPRHYFELGSKLIGLYCLVIAVPSLFGNVGDFFFLMERVPQKPETITSHAILFTVAPIVLVFMGLYLMRGSRFVRRVAFRRPEGLSTSQTAELFTLGLSCSESSLRWALFRYFCGCSQTTC